MSEIQTPTRYIYYDECTPQDTLPSSSFLSCYSFNTPHPLASKWREQTLRDPGAMLGPDPMPPANRRGCSRKRKIERKRKKSLLLDAKMSILKPHALLPSPHLGR